MITITRGNGVWRCSIAVEDTPAKYYVVDGSGVGAPHVRGEGKSPYAALDNALLNLGLLTISNPTDVGRDRPQ